MQDRITKIAIGIQARSSSKRLPRKVHMRLTKMTVLDHVIKACRDAAIYVNRSLDKRVSVHLLVPIDDEIVHRPLTMELPVIEGPEEDVLTRYAILATKTKANYVCRVTADCPLIPPFLISKMIMLAVINGYDYVSNVEEQCRTAADGVDCEVFSVRMLTHLNQNAEGKDREHVTTLARRSPPEWARYGTVINFLDQSDVKFSVDTEEDLERVRRLLSKVETKYEMAVKLFGKHCVHRF